MKRPLEILGEALEEVRTALELNLPREVRYQAEQAEVALKLAVEAETDDEE